MKFLFKKKSIILAFTLLFMLNAEQKCQAYMSTLDYIEAGICLATLPAVMASNHRNGNSDKTSKRIHCIAHTLRLARNLYVISRPRPRISKPASCFFWTAFDGISLLNELRKSPVNEIDEFDNLDDLDLLDEDENDEVPSEVAQTLTEKIIRISQVFLLPLAECGASFYAATQSDPTPEAVLSRRRANAFYSLSRGTSIFLNHPKSLAALCLLLSAVTETVLALRATVARNNNFNPNQQGTNPNQQNRQNPQNQPLGYIPNYGVVIINRGTAANPIYAVYRDGVRQQDLPPVNPLTHQPWQPGEELRVFRCNHAVSPFDENIALDNCRTCGIARDWDIEVELVIPAPGDRIRPVEVIFPMFREQGNCPICFEDNVELCELGCTHRYCVECLGGHVTAQYNERGTNRFDHVNCPDPACNAHLSRAELLQISRSPQNQLVPENVLDAYDDAVEAHVQPRAIENALTPQELRERGFKQCPNPACRVPIDKDGACRHVQCNRCQHEFCWWCLGDNYGYNHEANGCRNNNYGTNPNDPNQRWDYVRPQAPEANAIERRRAQQQHNRF